MKKITRVLFVFFVLLSFGANAQHDLSDSDKEELKLRVVEKLDDFQSDLQILAGRNGNSLSAKQSRMVSTLNLFIGKGEKYWIKEPTANGFVDKLQPAVTMGIITSKYSGQRRHIAMKNYLSSLIRQSQYSRIDITQSDAVRVDSFNKVSDGRYVAVAHILQGFVRYNSEGKVTYYDTTAKRVTIYIDKLEQELPDGSILTFWEIKLGDVEAEQIW
ncbi:MAG: hypothetical protein IJK84_03475 [Bacteroidales bacterium]|nr:hypothetical protein [Bacteroidales bacterium]